MQRRALCAGATERSRETAPGGDSFAGAPAPVAGDYPDWLDPHLAKVFGDDRAAEGAALATRAPLDLRVNTFKAEREEIQPKFAHLHAEAAQWSPVGLRIRLGADAKNPAIHAEPPFRKGEVEVQDEGSQLAALFAGAKPGQQVIDLAAGAGGKTLALAAAMDNRGQIYATDIDKRQLLPIHERIARAGARNIQVRTPRGEADMLGDLKGTRRPGADRRAVHGHRHLAAQSRRQMAGAAGCARGTRQGAGDTARSRRRVDQGGRPYRLRDLFVARR